MRLVALASALVLTATLLGCADSITPPVMADFVAPSFATKGGGNTDTYPRALVVWADQVTFKDARHARVVTGKGGSCVDTGVRIFAPFPVTATEVPYPYPTCP